MLAAPISRPRQPATRIQPPTARLPATARLFQPATRCRTRAWLATSRGPEATRCRLSRYRLTLSAAIRFRPSRRTAHPSVAITHRLAIHPAAPRPPVTCLLCPAVRQEQAATAVRTLQLAIRVRTSPAIAPRPEPVPTGPRCRAIRPTRPRRVTPVPATPVLAATRCPPRRPVMTAGIRTRPEALRGTRDRVPTPARTYLPSPGTRLVATPVVPSRVTAGPRPAGRGN